MNLKPITHELALELGMTPLTSSYTKDEAWLLEKAVANLEAAGTSYAIVEKKQGLYIYRDKKGFKLATEDIVIQTKAPLPGVRCI